MNIAELYETALMKVLTQAAIRTCSVSYKKTIYSTSCREKTKATLMELCFGPNGVAHTAEENKFKTNQLKISPSFRPCRTHES